MGFFKSLFGSGGKKFNPDEGAMPSRQLNLPYAASASNGHLFAQKFVDAVKKNDGIELDYSVNSITFVDKFLQKFSDEGLSVNDFAETIFVAGSYVGQVMIANNNGQWIEQDKANLPNGISMMPIVVQLQNGTIADPIAKAFKRFHLGASDDLSYFYHVFTESRT